MWRHLRMLKRGARSYDQTGIKGTSPGELAVLCPACPIPSINLPPDWQTVGKDSECVDSLSANPFSLIAFAPDISTTRPLVSTHVSGSSDDKSRTTRRTQNWGPGTRTSLRGTRTASTFVNSLTRKRFVLFVPH